MWMVTSEVSRPAFSRSSRTGAMTTFEIAGASWLRRSTSSLCWVETTIASTLRGHAVLVVADRDLGLPVGTQVRKHPVAAGRGEVPGQAVRGVDRQRHQLGGVPAGVAEHQALVPGAEPREGLGRDVAPGLQGVVHALGDVRRLCADRDLDAAGVGVEALLRGVVPDLPDDVAHDRRDVAVPGGADLAGDMHEPGGH